MHEQGDETVSNTEAHQTARLWHNKSLIGQSVLVQLRGEGNKMQNTFVLRSLSQLLKHCLLACVDPSRYPRQEQSVCRGVGGTRQQKCTTPTGHLTSGTHTVLREKYTHTHTQLYLKSTHTQTHTHTHKHSFTRKVHTQFYQKSTHSFTRKVQTHTQFYL